ncbi:MAG: response regulator [Candidatus Competibacteraceae bacterium]|nr:response regulator [Candidatus Competibacteraceae bacterium]
MTRNVMIVEDDVFIASDLSEILKELGYDVLAIANNVKDALSLAKFHRPELILMDIGLNDVIDGVHLASILKSEQQIPVIFTTAFTDSETLERVKSLSPLGYIVKPYSTDIIKVTVELAFARIHETIISNASSEHVFINSVQGMVSVNPDDILYLEAFDYYANVITESSKILAKMTLKEVLETLSLESLVRVHKSYAINIKHIQRIKDNQIHISEHRIPIGRAYKSDLFQRIKIL